MDPVEIAQRVEVDGWVGVEFTTATHLAPLDGSSASPPPGPVPLLGNGLAVQLREVEGLTRIWGLEPTLPAPRELVEWLREWNGSPLPPPRIGGGLAWNASGWSRVLPPSPEGGHGGLQEVGLLFRDGPVVVVQYGDLSGGPARVRAVGPARAVDAAVPLLRPLRARQLQAATPWAGREQGAGGVAPLTLETDGPWRQIFRDSVEIVLGAVRPPHFLAGLDISPGGAVPVPLQGDALAEVALALTQLGHTYSAWAALDTLLQGDREGEVPSPRLLLLLAARWALSQGDPAPLLAYERTLDDAVEAAVARAELSVLEEFASSLEPLGRDGWAARVRSAGKRVAEGRTGRVVALPVLRTPGGVPGGKPLLGGSGALTPQPGRGNDTGWPQPDSFASPLLPTFLPRRTLQASRMVRSVLEGFLGVERDAALGRLKLAPRIPDSISRLALSGLAAGESIVDFTYRRSRQAHSFHLLQSEGRIPLNLTLQVRLEGVPAGNAMEVTMGGEPIEVEPWAGRGGWGFQVQFPLDPERVLQVAPAGSGS